VRERKRVEGRSLEEKPEWMEGEEGQMSKVKGKG